MNIIAISNHIGASRSSGGAETAFVFTVDTTLGDGLDNYTLNFTGAGYDIKTSDGQTITGATIATTINFAAPGTYDIEISGNVSTRTFANDLKLVDIKNWGVLDTPLDDKFGGANSLTTITAPDQPVNLSMTRLFKGAQNFAGGISHWNVSNIVSFQRAFYNTSFDEDISSWDTSSANTFSETFWGTPFNNGGQPGISNWNVSNVADFYRCFVSTPFNQPIGSWTIKTSGPVRMDYMFSQAASFNQDLNAWDVSSVTAMNNMFQNARSFNQDLNSWNLASVTNMVNMFDNAIVFNGNISSWAFPNVTSFVSLLAGAESFNQDISGWDTSGITNMQSMFRNTYAFNQPIGIWDTSSVTKMNGMFFASAFNQNINNWNVSLVDNMNYMFYNEVAFNQPLDNWDVSSVTDMSYMFRASRSFNQDLSLWNTSGVNNMAGMFSDNDAFNQDISSWDTSSVTDTQYMFFKATAFNQPIGSWNVGNVTNMKQMFNITSFNQDISSWDMSSVTSIDAMLGNNTAFNQPIGNWNTSNISNFGFALYNSDAFDQSLANWNILSMTTAGQFMRLSTGLSTSNYGATLVSWEAQLQAAYPGGVGYTRVISIDFGGSQYSLGSAAETARTSLINTYGWTITDGGGIASTKLLDIYSGASAAYSLRDLADASVGNPVVNVRRSSDNATQDFTSTEITDGTLLAFVGNTASDNGYVTTWYDQSGNGRDTVQAVNNSQPQIVSSGALILVNSLPTVDFNNGPYLETAQSFHAVNDASFVLAGLQKSGEIAYGRFASTYFSDGFWLGRYTGNQSISGGWGGAAGVPAVALADNTMGLMFLYRSGANSYRSVNGSAPVFQTTNSNITTARPFIIGESFSKNAPGAKQIYEMVLWDSDQSANRSGIESNMNNHYSIYP